MENLSILTGDIRLGRLVKFTMKHSVLTFALGLCIATPWMKAADSPKVEDFSGVWTTTATIDEFDSRNARLTVSKKEGKWTAIMVNEEGERTDLTRVVPTEKGLTVEFDMERDGQQAIIGAKAQLDKEGELKGEWYAKDGDGFELMKNKWVAVRSIKEDIAGSWNVTAKTDNGDMDHAMVMKKEGNRFSGYASSSEGDADFSNLKLEKNTLSMQVPYGGGIVKIKSKLIGNGQLKGKWTFFDEFDQEVATGEWIAKKKAKKS